jgi:tetratricopeptide (TPR) repeat protein
MATTKKSAPKGKAVELKDPEIKIEDALSRTESFLESNWKAISIVLAVIVLVIGGYYAYRGLYLAPRMEKASVAMFVAQHVFADGNYEEALNGDGNNVGFLEIVSKYGDTPQGKLAAHYAGICYLNEGDLDAALTFLSKYSPSRGVPNTLINAQNEGLKGDVYVQKGDYQGAVKHFERAVKASDNTLTTPTYLKKAGLAYEALGDYATAVKLYTRISDEYPTSIEGRDIDKYIGAAEQK